jgi:tRNA nucleotidyltransferase (CCA-adding enzyme)
MKPGLRFNDVLAGLSPATGEMLQRVVRVAAAQKIPIQLVGGPVRDLLLRRPVLDVDLLVEGEARELGEAIAADAGDPSLTIEAHDRFGTLRLKTSAAQIDLAQLRSEHYPHPGALPEVGLGTHEEDSRRRDFSINAMSCALDAEHPTKTNPICDFAGGLEDLRLGKLRILHPQSFHDDPTRAWRAARLSERLGFSLDRKSRSALRDALRDGAFGAVSGDRWRRELQRSFEEAEQGVHVGQILRSLSNWHVLAAMEPGLTLNSDRLAPLRRLSRAIATPDWVAPRSRSWVAGLSIWLTPLPFGLRRRSLERFSIRGEQAKRIANFGREAERWLRVMNRARGRGAVDAALSELPEEMVQALYALAPPPIRRRMLRWGAEDRRRRVPVGGRDLVEFGLSGPDVGRALARIRAGFLDGEIANREEALVLAEEFTKRVSRRRGRRKEQTGLRRVAQRSGIADTPNVDD